MDLAEPLDLSVFLSNVATLNQSPFFLIFTITCLFHWLIKDGSHI